MIRRAQKGSESMRTVRDEEYGERKIVLVACHAEILVHAGYFGISNVGAVQDCKSSAYTDGRLK